MPPKPKTTPAPTTQAPKAASRPARAIDQDRVAAIAYRLYEERGRQDGHDREDWLKAEQIVRAEQAVRDNAR